MEKIIVPIIEMMGKKCICIPEDILERLNFHSPLELRIDEVAQEINIKTYFLRTPELEQFTPIFQQIIEEDALPIVKAKVIPNPVFNPWDD